MRILVADALADACVDALAGDGHDVVLAPTTTAQDLVGGLDDVDVLVVRSTKVTAEALASTDRLALVVRAGAGTDTIDTAAASQRGVHVCNVPGRNAVAVAELTLGLLLAIDRHLPAGVTELRAGHWDKGRFASGRGLLGRRLALIGLGDIGLAVAERAAAYGMLVTTLARDGRDETTTAAIDRLGIEQREDLPSLLGDADVVSLHVPSNDRTRGMVDADFLAALPDGAIVLNTSRGDVVDAEALLAALEARGLRAGLDVWPDEPAGKQAEWTSSLSTHPAVVGSHHVGASTDQAQEAVAQGTVEVVRAFVAGSPLHCVNLADTPLATCQLVVRHLDRVGVLAQVFDVLRRAGHNVEEMSNRVFRGGEAAVATIDLDEPPSDEVVRRLADISEVLSVRVRDDLAP